MDMELRLPQGWERLPHWVREDLKNGSVDLRHYGRIIQVLVEHRAEMTPARLACSTAPRLNSALNFLRFDMSTPHGLNRPSRKCP